MGPIARLGIPLGQLDLTDAQRQQVRGIVEGHRAEMRQLADRGREAHNAVRQASEAQPFDETAVRAASNGLALVMADGAVLRAKVRTEVMGVLTDEQRAKAAELRTQAEERGQQRHQQRQQRMQERQLRMHQRQQNPGGVGG
jgi:Spy/CpxP family protein refolding chaperone